MKLAFIAATAAAFSVAALTSASAQTTKTTAPMEHVTITGCVASETSYRASHDEGKGGVVGTGLGAENEYVLTQASGSKPASAAGEGAMAATMAYELSGPAEGQLKQYVGKRVELVGMLKAQEIGPNGPTGGPTAKSVPGVDKVNKDLKLREFEVMSVKPAAGNCK